METVIDIRDSVVGLLAESFPGTVIYTETMGQETTPCFQMTDCSVTYNRIMGRRYARVYAFDIRYFPSGSSPEPIQDASQIAERLAEVMEYIPLGRGKLRGSGMRHEMVEGVMHFYFEIRMHVFKKQQSAPKMAAMDMEGRIKNEQSTNEWEDSIG
ncbi:hypothetical protein H8B09_02600 [Paenibacillus sp. PR3]|uniref:DUF3168 domain-containing protein n=1 Tax=Paenibacillus terricola TaxID=2763503 RepID=A0ABR8MNV9_9BACL|nr:hypothetical protein [Paenibacillus terricola]MBD3917628.1 hypothetical protein [Paenibacillus terricola]